MARNIYYFEKQDDRHSHFCNGCQGLLLFLIPQPLRAVGLLFSPMVSGRAGGIPAGRQW